MSTRCRCCDAPLTATDLKLTQEDGTPEDLCSICRGSIRYYDQEDDSWDHEYQFEDLTEGLNTPNSSDY